MLLLFLLFQSIASYWLWNDLSFNLANIGLFQKKIVTPLLRISMENSREEEEKSLEFQGGKQKIEDKTWISRGVTVNLTGNSGRSISKKSISSTGGYNFFSRKALWGFLSMSNLIINRYFRDFFLFWSQYIKILFLLH